MTDYERGWQAYWQGLTDDISESEAWHEGYDEAQSIDNAWMPEE